MKTSLLTLLILLLSLSLTAQDKDLWAAYYNQDSTLIGYKDQNGKVRIEPKFFPGMTPSTFNHIIPILEEANGEYNTYYLTKSGKVVGRDSMHVFDNGFDCESEGFIRFRDKKTDKAGLFNRNGFIAVPAEYNDLTRVRNGLFIGLKNAKKEYWDQHNELGCNHYSWVGGDEVLVDTLNNVQVENFGYNKKLNLYSLKITKQPLVDSIRVSFLGTNGSYYSFIDFEKEFRNWYFNELLPDLCIDKLVSASLDTIKWATSEEWDKIAAHQFIKKNYETLKKCLLEIQSPNCEYFISMGGLNPYDYEDPKYEKCFNDCGEADEWKYPTMDIVVTHKSDRDFSQNHYEFLRTDEGYRLMEVVVRDGEVKY